MQELTMKQRVEVAKDVIASIDAGKFKARAGTYAKTNYQPCWRSDLRNIARKAIASGCDVCARGAIALSAFCLYDGKINQLQYCAVGDPVSRLVQCGSDAMFGGDQSSLMEGCFEFRWRVKYPSHSERLIAIMNNVIKNNGLFIPENEEDQNTVDDNKRTEGTT